MDAQEPSDASARPLAEVDLPLYGFVPHKGVPIGSGPSPNTSGSWTPLLLSDVPSPSSSAMLIELAVLTYNVFQSSDLYHPTQRTHALLASLRSLCSPSTPFQPSSRKADVICLQEVSPDFEAMLRRERCLQRDWAMTDLRAVQTAFGKPPVSPLLPAQGSHAGKRKAGAQSDDRNDWDDGVMLLVRKSLLAGYKMVGRDVTIKAVPFVESRQYKGLLMLDVLSSSGVTPVRIATAHFDSLPENASSRLSSFAQTLAHLASPSAPPAIVAADFNHSSYAELSALLGSLVDVEWASRGGSIVANGSSSRPSDVDGTEDFPEDEDEDASLESNADSRSLDPFRSFPTFGHLFPFIPLPSSRYSSRGRGRGRGRGGYSRPSPRRKPRRTDLVLSSQGLEVVRVERVGTEPVKWGKGTKKGQEVREAEGKDGKLWASDHEGVLVTFRLPSGSR